MQIPIALLTGPGHNLCRFCEEELLFLQLADVLAHCVFTHTHRSPNRWASTDASYGPRTV